MKNRAVKHAIKKTVALRVLFQLVCAHVSVTFVTSLIVYFPCCKRLSLRAPVHYGSN